MNVSQSEDKYLSLTFDTLNDRTAARHNWISMGLGQGSDLKH